MVTGHFYGHAVYWDDESKFWRYTDTNERVIGKERPCPKCGEKSAANGHDSCIANLPGVKYACCGHGVKGDAYLMLENNRVIREHLEPELFNTTLKYLLNKRDSHQE